MASDLSQAAFLYRSGEERNFPFPDRPEVRVGFDRTNEVAVPFEGVSRRHARISFDGKSYWIEDLGSSNGTFVDGRQIRPPLGFSSPQDRPSAQLRGGEWLRIGDSNAVVSLVPPPVEDPRPQA